MSQSCGCCLVIYPASPAIRCICTRSSCVALLPSAGLSWCPVQALQLLTLLPTELTLFCCLPIDVVVGLPPLVERQRQLARLQRHLIRLLNQTGGERFSFGLLRWILTIGVQGSCALDAMWSNRLYGYMPFGWPFPW